jgi:hypothetical protein
MAREREKISRRLFTAQALKSANFCPDGEKIFAANP